jgi:hypothetical protein
MKILRMLVTNAGILTLACVVVGCRPKVDADLRPFLRLKDEKAAKLLLQKPVDQQIDIYLRIAALPFKPPDWSAGGVIALRNGDIGRPLSERISEERDLENLESLFRLAGQYCHLNSSCRGEFFLDEAVKTSVERIPNWRQNPFVAQNVNWVSDGVSK